jgi:hypothetical protein
MRIGLFHLLKPSMHPVVCKNISAGGLRMQAHEPLDTGTKVVYELVLPGLQDFAESRGRNPIPYHNDTLRGVAEVRWARPVTVEEFWQEKGLWNNGLMFLDLPKDTAVLLDELIYERGGHETEVANALRN